jgi:hypothetical protein
MYSMTANVHCSLPGFFLICLAIECLMYAYSYCYKAGAVTRCGSGGSESDNGIKHG